MRHRIQDYTASDLRVASRSPFVSFEQQEWIAAEINRRNEEVKLALREIQIHNQQ
jgi:hypothetical protein